MWILIIVFLKSQKLLQTRLELELNNLKNHRNCEHYLYAF